MTGQARLQSLWRNKLILHATFCISITGFSFQAGISVLMSAQAEKMRYLLLEVTAFQVAATPPPLNPLHSSTLVARPTPLMQNSWMILLWIFILSTYSTTTGSMP
uniref:Uncharacterized protein n=1 Tax=Arundo donax TaxID=35708 RepID=A0A0A9BYD8_ARUDO